MTDWLDFDRQHLWHPYANIADPLPVYPVIHAEGVYLTLANGKKLIDGMSSWWAAIHGYNHPVLNAAINEQLQSMAHVMFGGLTHKPAVELAQLLLSIVPKGLSKIFFADSGSVAVEIALKQAIQYWLALGKPDKNRFATVRSGYHGDTLGAMSVCDPVNGMHHLFHPVLMPNYFAPAPHCHPNQGLHVTDITALDRLLDQNHSHIAALILEPLVQGAGGMRFYCVDYLEQARVLCDEYEVLLICDEIATGFGRTGQLFACDYVPHFTPDILCLGKALTGGYLSLAATLCTDEVAETIASGNPPVFMHGPTFMANPLACAVAKASVHVLLDSPWQQQVKAIESQLKTELKPCQTLSQVKDVRVFGAIGVVELYQSVDMAAMQNCFVKQGVWVRPFNNLVYLMPPYIITAAQLSQLTQAIFTCLKEHA